LGRLSGASKPITHIQLGRAPYAPVLDLQRDLHALRQCGACGDVLITVEHDPVFTVGRRGSADNILVSPERLEQAGITVHRIERGGDITYHGPGQLVCYPILDLREYEKDLKGYIGRLEATIMRTLSRFGIAGDRMAGRPGIWIDGKKIASIGVHVRQWITMHGIALNVDVNHDHFAMIRPCGMDVETVSMSQFGHAGLPLEPVRDAWLLEAAAEFGWCLSLEPEAAWSGVADV